VNDVHVIEPSLFDQIDKYLKEFQESPKKADASRLRTFLENFFLQLFANELKRPITAIGRDAKLVSTRIRVQRKDAADAKLRRLLTRFEELCDLLPGITGQLSRPGESAPAHFSIRFMNQTLGAMAAWAEIGQDEALKTRARATRAAYSAVFPG